MSESKWWIRWLRQAAIILIGIVMLLTVEAINCIVWQPSETLTKICFMASAKDVFISYCAPNVEELPSSSYLDVFYFGILAKIVYGGVQNKILSGSENACADARFIGQREVKIGGQWSRQDICLGFVADFVSGRVSSINKKWPSLESQVL